MKKRIQKYVIGVDGGGTKTVAALANLKGRILKTSKAGPSSPRNVGIEKAAENTGKAIEQVLKGISKDDQILSTFIGLPAIEEEFRLRKREIKKELLKNKSLSWRAKIKKGKVIIESDQIVAFRSATDEKDGVLLIAGTGCIARGFKGKREARASGWGWLADEGSGFWVGQKVFQAILKDLDNRSPKTLLTKLVFKELKTKKKENLLLKVYPVRDCKSREEAQREQISNGVYSKDFSKIIPSFSVCCDIASQKGDKVAKEIMIEAGKELALAAKTVIKKLNFEKKEFPLVLVGSMFKSKIVLRIVQKETKKIAPKVKFLQPQKEPVMGAVKLALENLDKNY